MPVNSRLAVALVPAVRMSARIYLVRLPLLEVRALSGIYKVLSAILAAIVIVCGVLYLPTHRFFFQRSAYSEFFERLPMTLELVIASVIIGLALAAICTLLSRRPTAWLGAALAAVLFLCMCIPVFWIALTGQLVFAAHGIHIFGYFVQLPSAGFAQYDAFNITDRLTHLVLPATLLALVQAGAYVDSMRSDFSVRRLFAAFALLLPAILSADVLIEIIFAWPGVGRSFFANGEPYHTSSMVAFLLFGAAAVIIVRSVAAILSRPDDTDVEAFQPL